MTIQLSREQFDAALRMSQRMKGQRPHGGMEEEADKQTGGLRIDFSGLDVHRMWQAHHNTERAGMDFVARLDKVLPNWTDPSMLKSFL